MATIAVWVPNPERLARWVDHLGKLLPDHRIVCANEVEGSPEVAYAVVWKPPTGMIAGWSNVRATISIGAGIDHVLADREYPANVPILKTIGPDMIQRMREFVTLQVLSAHREMPALAAAQSRREWHQVITPTAQDRTVGIMGLGVFGKACARALVELGFDVMGWSRSGANVDGVRSHAQAGFTEFIESSQILVCLLPLTDQTRGILNAKLFAMLPVGAHVVNVGRGQHVVEQDLLSALESGQVSHAALDVFDIEPLPANHPYWTHPRISVTPHIASLIDPISGGMEIAKTISNIESSPDHVGW